MKTNTLIPHPLHEQVYGKPDADEKLIASIKELGILEPIAIAWIGLDAEEKHYILSGIRRWTVAKTLGMEEVPVREVDVSGLEAERFLLESNRQRQKTLEQRGREFSELKRIEAELAKQRQVEGGKKKGAVNLPEASKGDARDKAAEAVGMSARTAERLGLLVLEADSGDLKARAALDAVNQNDKSINKAYNEIFQCKGKPARTPRNNLALVPTEIAETDAFQGAVGKLLSRFPDLVRPRTRQMAIEGRKDIWVTGLDFMGVRFSIDELELLRKIQKKQQAVESAANPVQIADAAAEATA